MSSSSKRILNLSAAEIERFWNKLDVGGEDDCWNFKGKLNRGGYGQLYVAGGGPLLVHRIAFTLANGPISQGMAIDHLCHNRACANPGHLREATAGENAENRASATVKSKTGVRGVSWHPPSRKYRAVVFQRGKSHSAGYFERLEDADAAVRALRAKLFSYTTLGVA